jgi:hypothetical protein
MGHDGQTIADSAIESPISRRLTVARSWPEFFCEGMRWVFISARVCALGARRYEFVEQAHRQALTHLRHRGVRAAAASHRNLPGRMPRRLSSRSSTFRRNRIVSLSRGR